MNGIPPNTIVGLDGYTHTYTDNTTDDYAWYDDSGMGHVGHTHKLPSQWSFMEEFKRGWDESKRGMEDAFINGDPNGITPTGFIKTKEGIEMKGFYNVYLIYGEDRKNIVIKEKRGIIASSEEDAKIKSRLLTEVKDEWDDDYLTILVEEIGEVAIKVKPREFKQVEK